MDFRANPYIKTPLVGFFRTHSFLLAICKIIINNAVKIIYKFFNCASLIRKQGLDSLNLAKQYTIFLCIFNTPDISLIDHSVIHISPIPFRLSNSAFT